MAAIGTGRSAFAGALLGALVIAGGCRGGDPDPPPPPATGTPTEVASPTLDPVANAIPSTPDEYADQAVAAWVAPDLIRLAELTTEQVYQDLIDLPRPPDPAWTSIHCEDPEPDRAVCGFYNAAGDHLLLTLDHALLGEPEAVVGVSNEVTTYPDDPVAYVAEFVAAWQDGNLARMQLFAHPDAVTVFSRLAPETVVDHGPGDGRDEVVVRLADGEVVAGLDLDRLGGQQAIQTATTP